MFGVEGSLAGEVGPWGAPRWLRPRKRAKVMAAVVCSLAGLAACTSPSVAVSEPSRATAASCVRLTDVGAGGEFTRYRATAGSTWWVTYAVLANPCGHTLTLVGVQPAGPLQGSDVQWTGRAGAALPDAVVTAVWASTDGIAAAPVNGWEVAAGQQVQILAEVRQIAGAGVHGVPALTLTATSPQGAQTQVRLTPEVALTAATGP